MKDFVNEVMKDFVNETLLNIHLFLLFIMESVHLILNRL